MIDGAICVRTTDFQFVAKAFPGLYKTELRAPVIHAEDDFQLSALHDCRCRHAQ